MSNVVRLVSGGTIHVRTGVIQGIGAQGPQGSQGNPGQQGEQGPPGEQGEMGQILQQSSRTKVGSNNPLGAATDTVISFGSVQGLDELNCIKSSSNIGFDNPGDYLMCCWLRFDDAAATARELWFQTGSTIIARTSRMAGAGGPFYVDLSFPFRANGGEVINVLARSGTATGISDGALSVVRTGSGPKGDIGPVGPQGPIGPQGAKGDPGVPGTANAGFTKYADLLPH